MAGKPQDIYMQFADLSVNYDASDSTALVKSELQTGLSVRGGLVWLIHLVEVVFAGVHFISAADNSESIGISSRDGRASVPTLGDYGTIMRAEHSFGILSTGGAAIMTPYRAGFLPPIPFAGPRMHLYAATNANDALMRGKLVEVRLGFTTEPVEAKIYAELAEVWEHTT